MRWRRRPSFDSVVWTYSTIEETERQRYQRMFEENLAAVRAGRAS